MKLQQQNERSFTKKKRCKKKVQINQIKQYKKSPGK